MIGTVYKIISAKSDDVYIGSTFNELRVRWQQHKKDYAKFLLGVSNRSLSIYPLFDKYGLDNFKIIAIEEYEVEDRSHLRSKEQLWISKLSCINSTPSFNPLVFSSIDGWLFQMFQDFIDSDKEAEFSRKLKPKEWYGEYAAWCQANLKSNVYSIRKFDLAMNSEGLTTKEEKEIRNGKRLTIRYRIISYSFLKNKFSDFIK